MATALISTLGSWEAENVTVAQIESALSSLRRHEERAAVRTGVLSLVCLASSASGTDHVLQTVDGLGARHPARTLMIVTEPAGEDNNGSNIDAAASVQVAEIDGRAVCYELVVLHVRGRARFRLDSIIRPLTLSDLPVAVWTPTELVALGDPVLGVGDRMLVDTRAVTDGERALPHVAKLIRHIPVTDLSWVRLAPWRNLLAGLFQGSVNRPFLGEVDHVEVSGRFAPRHLLGGWLMSRLGLAASAVTLRDASHVSIRISAGCMGKHGTFEVARPTDEQIIEARVDIEDGPSWTQTLRMRDRWPSRALADALTHPEADVAYRGALTSALGLLA